jgi:predicted metal-binding protein
MTFKPASAPASLVVCSTCRFSAAAREDDQGQRGGAIFAGQLRQALADHPCRDRLDIQTMPCLFACSSHCTAFLRSEGRLGYILGKFTPTADSAVALVDFAAHYLASSDGVVPYASWPQGVKGHFLVRVPPENFVWDTASPVSNADLPEKPEGESP